MGSNSMKGMKGVGRTDAFLIDPDELSIVDDPSHPNYDRRIHKPLKEEMVLNIMAMGVLKPVIIGAEWKGFPAVVDGRQRVRHAREANKRRKTMGEPPIRVTCVRKRGSDAELAKVAVSANEFAQEDEPIAKAEKAARLADLGSTNEEICLTFGWSIKTLKAHLSLLDAAPAIKKAVAAGELAVSAVSKLPTRHEEQTKVLAELTKDGGKATVRKAARIAKGKPAIAAPTKEDVERLAKLIKKDGVAQTSKSFARGAAWARGLLKVDDAWLSDALEDE